MACNYYLLVPSWYIKTYAISKEKHIFIKGLRSTVMIVKPKFTGSDNMSY